jgi:hypothetical protein
VASRRFMVGRGNAGRVGTFRGAGNRTRSGLRCGYGGRDGAGDAMGYCKNRINNLNKFSNYHILSWVALLPKTHTHLMKKLIQMAFCLASLPALLGPMDLHAQSTQTQEFDYLRPYEETEIFQTGALGLFDSNLGTLTGATLFLSGGILTDLTVSSFAVTTTNIRVQVLSDLFFGSDLASVNALLASESVGLVFDTGLLSYAVGETRTFLDQTVSNEISLNLNSVLGDLQASGGGSFNLTAQTLSGINIIGGGGNVSTSQSTSAFSGGRIVYSYNPVPEPGSTFLVALALVAPWVGRRRRAV